MYIPPTSKAQEEATKRYEMIKDKTIRKIVILKPPPQEVIISIVAFFHIILQTQLIYPIAHSYNLSLILTVSHIT